MRRSSLTTQLIRSAGKEKMMRGFSGLPESDDMERQEAKRAYVENQQKILNVMFKIAVVVIVLFVGVFLLRWAYTDWYVATHCTMVLGTRVCH
jgi:CHASE3 domain sensor protein